MIKDAAVLFYLKKRANSNEEKVPVYVRITFGFFTLRSYPEFRSINTWTPFLQNFNPLEWKCRLRKSRKQIKIISSQPFLNLKPSRENWH